MTVGIAFTSGAFSVPARLAPGWMMWPRVMPIVAAISVVQMYSSRVLPPMRPSLLISPRLAAPATRETNTSGTTSIWISRTKMSPMGLSHWVATGTTHDSADDQAYDHTKEDLSGERHASHTQHSRLITIRADKRSVQRGRRSIAGSLRCPVAADLTGEAICRIILYAAVSDPTTFPLFVSTCDWKVDRIQGKQFRAIGLLPPGASLARSLATPPVESRLRCRSRGPNDKTADAYLPGTQRGANAHRPGRRIASRYFTVNIVTPQASPRVLAAFSKQGPRSPSPVERGPCRSTQFTGGAGYHPLPFWTVSSYLRKSRLLFPGTLHILPCEKWS